MGCNAVGSYQLPIIGIGWTLPETILEFILTENCGQVHAAAKDMLAAVKVFDANLGGPKHFAANHLQISSVELQTDIFVFAPTLSDPPL